MQVNIIYSMPTRPNYKHSKNDQCDCKPQNFRSKNKIKQINAVDVRSDIRLLLNGKTEKCIKDKQSTVKNTQHIVEKRREE